MWYHCHLFSASSWTRQSRPLLFFHRGCTFLDGEDNCMLSVPSSTSDLHYCCWQSVENCQVVCAVAFTSLCHAFWFSLQGCSLYCFSVFVFLPTRCLLEVSRLIGLTLRPSAPVCCCHRDSFTRGRLAFAQEAVRVSSTHSPRLFLHVMTCAW